MELLRISETKLKIILTDEDMSSYSLSVDEIDYDDASTRRAIRSILTFAKNKTGFDFDKDRIFIQLYPSRNGGCELYVTKLLMESAQDTDKSPARLPVLHPLHRNDLQREPTFVFSNMTDLILCCHALLNENYKIISDAYYSFVNSIYYLKLKCDGNCLPDRIADIILEYGQRNKNTKFVIEKNEYLGELCIDCAVEILGRL